MEIQQYILQGTIKIHSKTIMICPRTSHEHGIGTLQISDLVKNPLSPKTAISSWHIKEHVEVTSKLNMARGKHLIKIHMKVIPKHTSMHHRGKHNDCNELNKMAFHNK